MNLDISGAELAGNKGFKTLQKGTRTAFQSNAALKSSFWKPVGDFFMKSAFLKTITGKDLYAMAELSTAEQRGINGAFSLLIQPAVDIMVNRHINKADDETVAYSGTKTVIKLAISTMSGVATRLLAQKYGAKLVPGIIPVPKGVEEAIFRKGVSSAVSFIAVLASSIFLDIPVINTSLNFIMSKLFPDFKQKKSK